MLGQCAQSVPVEATLYGGMGKGQVWEKAAFIQLSRQFTSFSRNLLRPTSLTINDLAIFVSTDCFWHLYKKSFVLS